MEISFLKVLFIIIYQNFIYIYILTALCIGYRKLIELNIILMAMPVKLGSQLLALSKLIYLLQDESLYFTVNALLRIILSFLHSVTMVVSKGINREDCCLIIAAGILRILLFLPFSVFSSPEYSAFIGHSFLKEKIH